MKGHRLGKSLKLLTNFAVYDGWLDEYDGVGDLERDCAELGLDGIEVVWGDDESVDPEPTSGLVVGYHMLFFSTWVDFWLGKKGALLDEFGTWEAVKECYGAETRDELVARFKRDLLRAIDFGAEYVVFHVSDVRMHECFSYEFSHTDRQVCDCACELINQVFDGVGANMALLVENQWWPGFTFCDPNMTHRLLDGIAHENTGIMLDTGHLMSTNRGLRTQGQAIDYIRECYDAHGDIAQKVRGMHLHQSLSGDYVNRSLGIVPDDFAGTYEQRFTSSYRHVLNIDRHEPWTDPAIGDLVRHIGPEWVTSELSYSSRAEHNERVRVQLDALKRER